MEDIERKLTLREERDRLLEILRVLPNEDYKDAEAKRLLNVRLTTINEALANEPIHAGKAETDKDVLTLTTEAEDMSEAIERLIEMRVQEAAEKAAEKSRKGINIKATKNVMETFGCSIERAMDVLKIKDEDRAIVEKNINKKQRKKSRKKRGK
jgi:hypothetical protein